MVEPSHRRPLRGQSLREVRFVVFPVPLQWRKSSTRHSAAFPGRRGRRPGMATVPGERRWRDHRGRGPDQMEERDASALDTRAIAEGRGCRFHPGQGCRNGRRHPARLGVRLRLSCVHAGRAVDDRIGSRRQGDSTGLYCPEIIMPRTSTREPGSVRVLATEACFRHVFGRMASRAVVLSRTAGGSTATRCTQCAQDERVVPAIFVAFRKRADLRPFRLSIIPRPTVMHC